jgi:hypothetical protein
MLLSYLLVCALQAKMRVSLCSEFDDTCYMTIATCEECDTSHFDIYAQLFAFWVIVAPNHNCTHYLTELACNPTRCRGF